MPSPDAVRVMATTVNPLIALRQELGITDPGNEHLADEYQRQLFSILPQSLQDAARFYFLGQDEFQQRAAILTLKDSGHFLVLNPEFFAVHQEESSADSSWRDESRRTQPKLLVAGSGYDIPQTRRAETTEHGVSLVVREDISSPSGFRVLFVPDSSESIGDLLNNAVYREGAESASEPEIQLLKRRQGVAPRRTEIVPPFSTIKFLLIQSIEADYGMSGLSQSPKAEQVILALRRVGENKLLVTFRREDPRAFEDQAVTTEYTFSCSPSGALRCEKTSADTSCALSALPL